MVSPIQSVMKRPLELVKGKATKDIAACLSNAFNYPLKELKYSITKIIFRREGPVTDMNFFAQ